MRQIKITSANYMPQEPTVPDAIMDDADLRALKKLAGIQEASDMPNNSMGDTVGIKSPLSDTDTGNAVDKYSYEKQHKIKPGSDEWFRLWFSRTALTGEKPTDTDKKTNTLFSKPAGK